MFLITYLFKIPHKNCHVKQEKLKTSKKCHLFHLHTHTQYKDNTIFMFWSCLVAFYFEEQSDLLNGAIKRIGLYEAITDDV